VPPLKPGTYNLYLSILDDQINPVYRMNYSSALGSKEHQITDDLFVEKIEIASPK
jgi:hypothetical protein